jgi:tRNA nucleotidyltransferase/poly(A) polymerase
MDAALLALLEPHVNRFYYVGGFTRDQLLGRFTRDVDVVLPLSFAQMRTLYEDLKTRNVKRLRFIWDYHNIAFELEGRHLDLVPLRKETYQEDSPYPRIAEGTFEEDVLRRDFTINAIYLEIKRGENPRWIDPLGGIKDLKQGILRSIRAEAFEEDPSRVIRLYIYRHRYGLEIEARTLKGAMEAGFEKLGSGLLVKYLNKVLEEKNLPLLQEVLDRGIFEGIGLRKMPSLTGEESGRDVILALVQANPGAKEYFKDRGN